MPIKSESVIQDIIEAVESGQFIISDHAALRMKERNIDFSDVEEAVYRATREEIKDSPTNDGLAWKYAFNYCHRQERISKEEKMTTKKKIYTFTGFGFDVLLHNVEIKEMHGETYPDIDMNEVKLLTAKELLKGRERLTGKKLKFLRTFLKLSYQKLSEIIDVPASTLRTWEDRGNDVTGLSVPEERQLRVSSIDSLLDLEKKHFEKQIIMTESFDQPSSNKPVDLGLVRDYSFLKEA